MWVAYALVGAMTVLALARPYFINHTLGKHGQKGYEAAAHIAVGGLFFGWYFGGPHMFIVTFWVATAVEVGCALVTVFMKRRQNASTGPAVHIR